MIDLTDVAVIDNHCHAVEAAQAADVTSWRQSFTESPDPVMREYDSAHTGFYRRLIRAMAAFHHVEPTEDAVLEARGGHGAEALVASLFSDAYIGGVVIDTGYPAPDKAMAPQTFAVASGARQGRLLRLELLFQELVAEHASYVQLVEALPDRLADMREAGYVGFKSIVGYRTGLAIQRWPEPDARAAFDRARAEAGANGSVRLGHKPLLDTLLHLALAAAAAQELPVQFHVGYGDPDADLRKAAPLQLREVLEERAYRSMPIVLLHGCWPYFREGAYLASVYGNAYLDLSYAIPFLSLEELTSMTRAALGTAPFTKLMYSSDGARVPELHWLGAKQGRVAIGTVLGELVADGALDEDEARTAGEWVLRENAARVYGILPEPR